MQTKQISSNMIVYHEERLANHPDLAVFLESDVLKKLLDTLTDTIIVLGGDGTLLWAIQQYADQNKSFLGINFGSKGNLMIHRKNLRNGFLYVDYPLLEVTIHHKNEKITGVAFNEVVCKSTCGRTIELNWGIRSEKRGLVGDGLIVATPSGSSGYSLAAGGSELEKGSFIMTPLVPFDPIDAKPIIFPEDEELVIEASNTRHRSTSVYVDGAPLIEHTQDPLTLHVKKSETTVTLLRSV